MRLTNKLKGDFTRGAVQLALAGIFTRLLGLINRMALSRLVGAEGLGLFQMIMPLYALLAAVAGLGLSGAVTKMVADRHALKDRPGQQLVRSLSLKLVFVAALACTFLLWLALSKPLGFIPDQRILLALRLMPAAFFFAALSSILRGYTQGQSKMASTALSQVGEQVVRVALGLAAVYYLLPFGLEYALAGIVAGIIGGEIACFMINYFLQKERKLFTHGHSGFKELYKEMFLLSVPILIIRLSTSVTQAVESMLIPSRLKLAGFSDSAAAALFGQLTGMALPMIFLPTVLIIPIVTTLVPAIAGSVSLHLRSRLERLIKLSLWGTTAIGASATIFFFIFAEPLTVFLFGDDSAAGLVTAMAPLAPFAYLQFTTAAILHGMGKPGVAVINDLGGTMISLMIIFYLTASPYWGIKGVVCGYTVSFILIAIADLISIFFLARKV